MKVPAVINFAVVWDIIYIMGFAESSRDDTIWARITAGGQIPPCWPIPNLQKQRHRTWKEDYEMRM